MAHTMDEEARILAGIKMLEGGEMKHNLLKAFLRTLKDKKGMPS